MTFEKNIMRRGDYVKFLICDDYEREPFLVAGEIVSLTVFDVKVVVPNYGTFVRSAHAYVKITKEEAMVIMLEL